MGTPEPSIEKLDVHGFSIKQNIHVGVPPGKEMAINASDSSGEPQPSMLPESTPGSESLDRGNVTWV